MGKMKNDFTLSRADSALLARDFTLAARLYRMVLREDPQNKDVLSKLGSTYIKAGQDERAVSAFESVLRIDPSNFDALTSLGGIFRRLGKYKDSITVLEQALKINHTTDVLYNLGFTYKLMEDYGAAAECFVDVIDENPNDVLAYNHLGTIMARNGDHKKALQTYWKGLQVDQNHPVLHYNSALSYIAQNNYTEARNSFENALRAKPGWPDAMDGLAELYLKESKIDDAQDIMTQALKINPENQDLLMTQGRIHEHRGDYSLAEGIFRNLLEKRPDDYRVMNHLEGVYEKENRFEEALALLGRMRACSTDGNELDKKHIRLLIDHGNLEDAGKMIEAARAGKPEDVDYLSLLAQYYVRSGQEEKASGCLKRIAEINPDSVRCLKDAAEQYIRMEEYDKAEVFLSQYLQKHPENAEALRSLGNIYERQNRYQDSLNAYKAVLDKDTGNSSVLEAVSRVGAMAGNNRKTMSMVSNILSSDDGNDGSPDEIHEKIRLYENSIGSIENQPRSSGTPVDQSVGQDDDSGERIDFDDFLKFEYKDRNDLEDDEYMKLSMEEMPVDFDSEDFDDSRQDPPGSDLVPNDMPYDYVGSKDDLSYVPLDYKGSSQNGPMEDDEILDVSGSGKDPEDEYFQLDDAAVPRRMNRIPPYEEPVRPYPQQPYPPRPAAPQQPAIPPEPVPAPPQPLRTEPDMVPDVPQEMPADLPEEMPQMPVPQKAGQPEEPFPAERQDMQEPEAALPEIPPESFDPAEELMAEDELAPEDVMPEVDDVSGGEHEAPVPSEEKEAEAVEAPSDEEAAADLSETEDMAGLDGPVEEEVSDLDDLFEPEEKPAEDAVPADVVTDEECPEAELQEEPELPELPEDGDVPPSVEVQAEEPEPQDADGAAAVCTVQDADRPEILTKPDSGKPAADKQEPEKTEPVRHDEKTTLELVGDALKTASPVPSGYSFKDAADMFRTLRKLTDSLLPVQREVFLQSLHSHKLDYVIERLSGKPGLLAAAVAIRKTGGIAGLKTESNPGLLKKMTYIRTLSDNRPAVSEVNGKGGFLRHQLERM